MTEPIISEIIAELRAERERHEAAGRPLGTCGVSEIPHYQCSRLDWLADDRPA